MRPIHPRRFGRCVPEFADIVRIRHLYLLRHRRILPPTWEEEPQATTGPIRVSVSLLKITGIINDQK